MSDNKKTGNDEKPDKNQHQIPAGSGVKPAAAESRAAKKAAGTKKSSKKAKSGSAKKTDKNRKKSGADKKDGSAKKPDTEKKTAGKADVDLSAAAKKQKIKNSNLRLIKNGDSPAENPLEEKETSKQSTPKQAPEEKGPAKKPSKEKETSKKTPSKKEISEKTLSKKVPKEQETGKTLPKAKEPEKKPAKKRSVQKSKKRRGTVRRSVKEWDYGRDRADLGEWFIQNKSLVIIGLTVFAVAVLLISVYYYIITNYEVTTVYVDGNMHYTNEEIMHMVMDERYGSNSLYLSLKYKDKGVEGVPFVEKMDVNILAPDTIRISVYEKAIAGYVEYLGQYMYFDKDGIIVESSDVRTKGVPQVTGLDFNYVVMYEPLPVENEDIFKQILGITQLLDKYKLNADKIFFDSAYDMTLYFGGVRVTIASEDEVDEKLMKLPGILPKLEGKRGMLHYMEEGKSISFKED